MENLYYIKEKVLNTLDENTGEVFLTGWATITGYEIDIQAMHLVEVFKFEILSKESPTVKLQEWFDSQEDSTKYNFIQL